MSDFKKMGFFLMCKNFVLKQIKKVPVPFLKNFSRLRIVEFKCYTQTMLENGKANTIFFEGL